MAEIICDNVHIHPAVVRATFTMMGADRMILISDSMRATGMPDGTYTLGGLDVSVNGNRATLVDGGALARFRDQSDGLYAHGSESHGDPAGNGSGLRNSQPGPVPGCV